MEPSSHSETRPDQESGGKRESIVARLFGFGRKRTESDDPIHPRDEPMFERRGEAGA